MEVGLVGAINNQQKCGTEGQKTSNTGRKKMQRLQVSNFRKAMPCHMLVQRAFSDIAIIHPLGCIVFAGMKPPHPQRAVLTMM